MQRVDVPEAGSQQSSRLPALMPAITPDNFEEVRINITYNFQLWLSFGG